MIGQRPLFPPDPERYKAQLEDIVQVLGSVSKLDLRIVADPDIKGYLKGCAHKEKTPWKELFPEWKDPIALDLLDQIMQFNPNDRICTEDAIYHPYFSNYFGHRGIHKCDMGFSKAPSIEYESDLRLTMQIFEQIREFRGGFPPEK